MIYKSELYIDEFEGYAAHILFCYMDKFEDSQKPSTGINNPCRDCKKEEDIGAESGRGMPAFRDLIRAICDIIVFS